MRVCSYVSMSVSCRHAEDTGLKVTFIRHEIEVKLSPDD